MGLKSVIMRSLLLNFHLTQGSCLERLKHYLTAELKGSIHLSLLLKYCQNRFADYFELQLNVIRVELDLIKKDETAESLS